MDPQGGLRTRVIVHTYNPHIGSFLPSLGSLTNQSLLGGLGGRHCYEIKWKRIPVARTFRGTVLRPRGPLPTRP
jgi:hypothetical protein